MSKKTSEKTRTIYLIRHAIAAERGEKWPDDTLRPLTHDGAARMRQVVRGLGQLEAVPELIMTSPLVRAASTAKLVAEGLTPAPDVITLPALAPGSTPSRVVSALAPHNRRESIALVGHEPDLGELAAWLIGARAPLAFKKGGVCRIDFDHWPPSQAGRLIWLATPRMLRGL